MPNTFKEQVREFIHATTRSYSYNPFKNVYIWFGILWGLPIPLVSMLFQSLLANPHSVHDLVRMVISTPAQWLFLLHPPLFGVLFGILGTIRHQKDAEVSQLIEELRLLSIIDPLTGLSNRRHFSRLFEDELARSKRRQAPLSLLFLDLDRFKQINDTLGHRVGDDVLRSTGYHLRTSCRPYDKPARWGGEEFLILLPETDECEAGVLAERLRQAFAADRESATPARVTVSIGVAEYRQGDTLESFVDRADQALYQAKEYGRNRVVRWSSLPSPT